MNIMTGLEFLTYLIVFYGAYVCAIALRNIHSNDWGEVFSKPIYADVFQRFITGVLLAYLTWCVAYVSINTIHHIVATGVLPGSIEVTWRLGHLVLNLTIVRIAQMVLFMEQCRKTQITTPPIFGFKFTFKLPFYFNTITKSYF